MASVCPPLPSSSYLPLAIFQPSQENLLVVVSSADQILSVTDQFDILRSVPLPLLIALTYTTCDVPTPHTSHSLIPSHTHHTPSPTHITQERLYIVLDTNVLLSHLQFLVELKDYAIKGVGRPVLVVPWVVMQELDALKSNKEKKVGERARRAIASLHSCFSNRHPRVRGETLEEVCGWGWLVSCPTRERSMW